MLTSNGHETWQDEFKMESVEEKFKYKKYKNRRKDFSSEGMIKPIYSSTFADWGFLTSYDII